MTRRAHAVQVEPVPDEMRRRSRRFVLGLLVLLAAVALWVAWPYRAAVVMALFLGYLLHPVYTRLRRPLRWKSLAAGVILLLVAAALFVPLALVGRELVQQAGAMRETFSDPGALEGQATALLARIGVPEETARSLVSEWGASLAGSVQSLALGIVTRAPHVILGFVVFFLLLFYVLVDGHRLVEAFHKHVPLARERRDRLLKQGGDRVRAILLGSFLVYALQGLAGALAWWVLGYPAPVFWGFVMMLLAILPFMGPQIVMIPAGLLRILQGDTVAGVALIAYSLVVVSLIDDLVRPVVIGKRANVHPALVLLGTLGGLEVFGLAGFVLGPLLLGLLGPVLESWSETTPDPPDREGAMADGVPRGSTGRARRA